MIDLDLDRINAKSPYLIKRNERYYDFSTEKGTRYRIFFDEETPLGGCDTYQFTLLRLGNEKSTFDSKISATVFVIIDEFFTAYNDVLLYICDTSDSREEGRNRLFLRWFQRAANPRRFTIRTAHAQVETGIFYAAIIVDNSNPKLFAVTKEFDEVAAVLSK